MYFCDEAKVYLTSKNGPTAKSAESTHGWSIHFMEFSTGSSEWANRDAVYHKHWRKRGKQQPENVLITLQWKVRVVSGKGPISKTLIVQ